MEQLEFVIPITTDVESVKEKYPYEITEEVIEKAVKAAERYIGKMNTFLEVSKLPSLSEVITTKATFSALVSDLFQHYLAEHSRTLTKNMYHNGHPDLVPIDR